MNVSGLSASLNLNVATQGRLAAPSAGRADSPSRESSPGQLSPEELAQVDKLKAQDRAVRQHEQAHLAAAGGLATSGASYTYQRGPDGVNYAVGGEVSISVSPGRTPEETLRRAQTIRAAALAPSDPSGADRAVAAQASKLAQEAMAELAAQRQEQAGATKTSGGQSQNAGDFRLSGYGQSEPKSRESLIDTFA